MSHLHKDKTTMYAVIPLQPWPRLCVIISIPKPELELHHLALKSTMKLRVPYVWTDMVLDPTNSITETERQAIGALHYDAGVSVGMSYASDGSAGSIGIAADRLVDTFGYANTSYGANHEGGWQNMTTTQIEKMVNTNLDTGLPVILHIAGTGGHTILADGYGTNISTVYHHLNMGWAGFDDEWYNMPDIQTTTYDFIVIKEVVYNIFKQNDGEIVSGKIVDGGGIPVQGVLVTATDGGETYTDITDSRGVFALANAPSATSFIVTSSKAGYTFLPAQHNVTTAISANNGNWPTSGNVWGIDFIVPLTFREISTIATNAMWLTPSWPSR